jgi:plasmid stabilization system protein ParE
VMRADYDPSARSFLIGDHIVVYKIRGETIIVSRVFHPRQDINRIAIDQK